MSEFPITDKTQITRLPKRGTYDKDTIYGILDEALFCTLAYYQEGQPFQVPTGFCRIGNILYVHGSVGSSYMRRIAEGIPVCISATVIDGLVLARSAFHHSVNYRSAVLFGTGRKVTEDHEQSACMEAFTNKMCPGRWNDVRKPTGSEWKATMVIAFEMEEASAKVRTGGPIDDKEDYDLNVWAGVQPLKLVRTSPIPAVDLKKGVELPEYLSRLPDGQAGVFQPDT